MVLTTGPHSNGCFSMPTGSVDIVAVCKLDRFFRNLRLLLNCLYGLEQLGIKFVSTQEGLDTSTPYGKFAVQIMGVIAEFERDRIGERVKDSRRYLISGGNWPGGRTAYGYRWLAQERKWEVIPAEVEVVRRIYDLYVNKKLGIESIAAVLNKEGLLTRDGAPWRFSAVRTVLTYPGYQGQHKIGIPMPAIIDENTWQLAQERRERARSVIANPRGWLLQGMCFCGLCGHVLKCLQKTPRERRYYACRARVQHRENREVGRRCDLPWLRADWLEHKVWVKVKEVLNDSGKLAECVNNSLVELEEKRKKIGVEAMAIDRRLEIIMAKEERLGIAFADGAVPENMYRSKLRQLKKEEADLLRCRHNIDPVELGELIAIGIHIDMVKEVLSKGSILVNDIGVFGELGDVYRPGEFSESLKHGSEATLGETPEKGSHRFEMTDMVVRDWDNSPGFSKV